MRNCAGNDLKSKTAWAALGGIAEAVNTTWLKRYITQF